MRVGPRPLGKTGLALPYMWGQFLNKSPNPLMILSKGRTMIVKMIGELEVLSGLRVFCVVM